MSGQEDSHSILWRRLDQPGHEYARLVSRDSFWHLSGTAVFAHEAQPCGLDYVVVCNKGWETVSAEVTGWVGDRTIAIMVSADSSRRWQINGAACPEEEGCIDLDLNFSPSTNLLTIRRLDLAVGQEAEVRAAWLRFPGFRLEPLPQRYRRIDGQRYRYQSAGGRFVAELEVNAHGFVTNYPNVWSRESGAAR